MKKNETLTQVVADSLLKMDKVCSDPDKVWNYPRPGKTIEIPLRSADGRETFLLDVEKHRIILSRDKYKCQTRTRQIFVLARLDIGGPSHQNPDGTRIDGSHLHLYNEEYGDKFAVPLSQIKEFDGASGIEKHLECFLSYCNIVQCPQFQKEVFQ